MIPDFPFCSPNKGIGVVLRSVALQHLDIKPHCGTPTVRFRSLQTEMRQVRTQM